jgi:hypothetical protein
MTRLGSAGMAIGSIAIDTVLQIRWLVAIDEQTVWFVVGRCD